MTEENQKDNIILNNQAIAGFMGYTFILDKTSYLNTHNFILRDYKKDIIESTPKETFGNEKETEKRILSELFFSRHGRLAKYLYSWDSLMAVVDKIEDLGVIMSIDNNKVRLHGLINASYAYNGKMLYSHTEGRLNQTRFEAVYNCVANFCKWYKSHGTITHKEYILKSN